MSKKKEHHHESSAATEASEMNRQQSADADNGSGSAGDTVPIDTGTAEKCEDPEAPPAETVESVKVELKSANDRYLRLIAEFDNYKKRTTREYQRMVESANEKLMTEMIAVRNNFELAIKHGETSADYQKLFDGVKLIFNKFDTVLQTNGLSAFAEKGEPFDPQHHEALMKTPHHEIDEDHIAEIYEKGYRLHDRIIRHAKVIVSSGKPETVETAAESTPS